MVLFFGLFIFSLFYFCNVFMDDCRFNLSEPYSRLWLFWSYSLHAESSESYCILKILNLSISSFGLLFLSYFNELSLSMSQDSFESESPESSLCQISDSYLWNTTKSDLHWFSKTISSSTIGENVDFLDLKWLLLS